MGRTKNSASRRRHGHAGNKTSKRNNLVNKTNNSKASTRKHNPKVFAKLKNLENEERLKQNRLRELEKQNQQSNSSENEEDFDNPLKTLVLSLHGTETNLENNVCSSDEYSLHDDSDICTTKDNIAYSDMVYEDIEDSHGSNSNKHSVIDYNIKYNDTITCTSINNVKNDEFEALKESNCQDNLAQVEPFPELDKFSTHLDFELNPMLLSSLSNNSMKLTCHELTWPILGKLVINIPTSEKCSKKSANILDENIKYAMEGTVPEQINLDLLDWGKIGVKPQLISNIPIANLNVLKKYANYNTLTPLQSELFSIMNGYQDLYYPNRSLNIVEDLRVVYCLHILNHLLKTRSRIIKHNSRISQQNCEISDNFRDQGFVRPRILVIVPFRHSALQIVRTLISFLVPDGGGSVQNSIRFENEFGGESIQFPKRNPKPEDYEQLFAGNTDDTFKLGIAITKKSMKLYADYYSSDIIIASPLGLRMAVGAPGEAKRDYDFLSSVELLIMDQADVFLAQNWDHVLHIMDHMHLQTKESHNTDFARVRMWALNGHSRLYRQSIVFASNDAPQLRAFISYGGRCCNYRGSARVANPIIGGSIREVMIMVPQVFHRLICDSATDAVDVRFNYFTKVVLPQYRGSNMAQCLLYIPDYFDYVRLRNCFKREEINFTQICEYTKESKMARARDLFYHGGASIMLYSERAHYFRRSRIKGIRHVIFYQPPGWPHFYSEICNLMQEANQNPKTAIDNNMTITILFTKYDILQVAGIVGTEKAARLIHSSKDLHMLITGD